MALGVVIAVGVPLLVLGIQATSEATGDTGAHGAPGATPGTGEGVDLLLSPDFECLPVRKDESVAADQYPVPRPPFSDDVFPCTECHDNPEDFNTTRRNLTLDHLDIELVHGPREQWCYGCHNPTNRDTLRLAGGREISFRESYELCGQCHGPKLRDWRLGIHGRRIGCWNGERQYLLCVHCHSPHEPAFGQLEPMPPPRKTSDIQLGERHAGSE